MRVYCTGWNTRKLVDEDCMRSYDKIRVFFLADLFSYLNKNNTYVEYEK